MQITKIINLVPVHVEYEENGEIKEGMAFVDFTGKKVVYLECQTDDTILLSNKIKEKFFGKLDSVEIEDVVKSDFLKTVEVITKKSVGKEIEGKRVHVRD